MRWNGVETQEREFEGKGGKRLTDFRNHKSSISSPSSIRFMFHRYQPPVDFEEGRGRAVERWEGTGKSGREVGREDLCGRQIVTSRREKGPKAKAKQYEESNLNGEG